MRRDPDKIASLNDQIERGQHAEELNKSAAFKSVMDGLRREMQAELINARDNEAVLMAGHALRSFLDMENSINSIALNGRLAVKKLENMSDD